MYSTYFPPEYSGAAKQALSLARRLRVRGHHVEFATVRWPGLPAEDHFDQFRVHRFETGRSERLRELRVWAGLLRYMLRRRGDFDVIHSHGAYLLNSAVGPLARLLGWKSVSKASLARNDLYGLGSGLSGRLHGKFLRQMDACVAISRDLEQEFLDAGLSRSKVLFLPNGVDTERFRPAVDGEKTELRRRLGLPVDKPLVLYVGVFDERKNIGWLAREWAENRGFGPSALLVAVGPQSREDPQGAFLAELRALAATNPAVFRVLGQAENVEEFFRAADAFVLPSLSEGLPNVVLEAMASGLPCVATRVSGTQELVEDGVTGWTFPVGDVEGLGSAVSRCLGGDRVLLGARARRRMEENYGLDVLAGNYEELYAQLLGRGTVSHLVARAEG
jgi:glycosyltransferase involved in cell wall biosynthesis